MTHTLSRLLAGARSLESRVSAALERTARAVAGRDPLSPLELLDRVGDLVARQVQPAGRGRVVWPFNRVCLTFAAPTAEERAHLEALCAGPPAVADRLRTRLEAAGAADAHLAVDVTYVAAADPAWVHPQFHVALVREERAPIRAAVAPRIDALVTHGTADRGAYSFTTLPIAIGRGAEVRDGRLQLVRVNHIAFAEDGDEVTRSVSRRHARIELDAATGRPRLIDDNSAQGTSIIRRGRGLAVPRGSRGLGLQSDDEIVLGQARLRVRVSDGRPPGV